MAGSASTLADRPLSWLLQVDEVCLRFEAAWQTGERPSIEEYLGDTPEPNRSDLLGELLALELAYRLRIRDWPTMQEYQRRFPRQAAVIASAFMAETLNPASPGTPQPADGDNLPVEGLSTLSAPASAGTPAVAPCGSSESTCPQPESVPDQVLTASLLPTPAREEREGIDLNRPRPPSGPTPYPAVPGHQIMGVLGRGGMGVVYLAWQVKLDRLVALKMILAGAHAAPEELARFRAEAEAVARLQHPHIVQVYEVGEQDNLPFFSLEYVDGGSLAKKLAGQPMPPLAAAALVETLARAMHYAHQRGIVHRDLKPSNILLTRGGIPKITDFGLAKRLDSEVGPTQSGVIVGTPGYMAPEQARGQNRLVGPAADVYALGAILYELLTGRPPFKARTPLDTVLMVLSEEPLPPSHLQGRLARDLETICLKCLQKDIGKRYASADALADDLHRFLGHEPIRARPSPVWERAAKWVRRRPAAAALLGVSAAALVGLGGVIGWHYTDLQAQLNAALRERERSYRQQKERETQAHRETLQAQLKELIGEAQEATGRKDWTSATQHYRSALARIEAEASDAQFQARAGRLREEIACIETTRRRLVAFRDARDEALFHETLLTGLDPAANRQATQAAARKALDAFGVAADAGGRLSLPAAYLQEDESTEITEGCYELLLVLAETVAQPAPGQDRADPAARALRILDRAAQLGHPRLQAYHLRRARYLDSLGDSSGARQERQEAEALPPSSALDFFLRGEGRYQQGDVPQALDDFQSALRARPDHFWAQYFLAACYLKLPHPRPDLARVALTTCLNRRPDLPWIYLLRGLACTELGEFEDAESSYNQRVLTASSDQTVRYVTAVNRGFLRIRQAAWARAVAELEFRLALLPNLQLYGPWAQAAESARQQRLAQAAGDLQNALRLKPGQYHAYVNLARVYQQQGKLEEAVAQATRAISRQPTEAALYRLRAQLQRQRKDQAGALADLDQALRLQPSGDGSGALARAHDQVERGRLYYESQKYEAAAKACQAALAVRSDYAPAHLLQAQALLQGERYEEAARALDQYLKTGKPTAEVYQARGRARAHSGNYAGALEDYTQALALAPDARALVGRGWIHLLAYDAPREALADFQAAIRRDPANGDAYNGRAFARVRLGQVRAAVADTEEALRRGPQAARLFYNAARTLAQAAAEVATDPGQQTVTGRMLRAHYQDRALELLRQALAQVAPEQRGRFWHDYIQDDRALAPIRRSPGFVRLAARYRRAALGVPRPAADRNAP